MASNPSARPSLRMVSASIPPSSASSRAARRIRSRLRGRRGSVFAVIDRGSILRRKLTLYDMHSTTEKGETMKAIVRDKYGPPDVLYVQEVEQPEPADDCVLVRVRACSVNPVDWHDVSGT